jgi:hypothetical protein
MLRRSSLVECVNVLHGTGVYKASIFFYSSVYVQPCLSKKKYTFYTIKSLLTLAYYENMFFTMKQNKAGLLTLVYSCHVLCTFYWYLQVAKQWYDYDRQTFTFVKKLKEATSALSFSYQCDFDEHGLMYWIGSNAK